MKSFSFILRLTAIVSLSFCTLSGCGRGNNNENGDCISHFRQFCFENRLYWQDSCEKFEDLISECACGCSDDNLVCKTGCNDPCEGVDCGNHGSCVENVGEATCLCDEGYHTEGLACVQNSGTNPCEGVLCSGHGTCALVDDNPICACDSGYHPEGLNCIQDANDPCEGINCSGHGTCAAIGNDPLCTCDEGYHAENLSCVENNTLGHSPVILDFDTNIDTMDAYDELIFSVVVTDPDGIDDLIGGTLKDAESDSTYGAFVSTAQEGSYTLTLTWNGIHNVRPIYSPEGGWPRVFQARFYDVVGNEVTQDLSVHLACFSDHSQALCDGQCTNFDSQDTCGDCETDCWPLADQIENSENGEFYIEHVHPVCYTGPPRDCAFQITVIYTSMDDVTCNDICGLATTTFPLTCGLYHFFEDSNSMAGFINVADTIMQIPNCSHQMWPYNLPVTCFCTR
jgi:hypothetical protein